MEFLKKHYEKLILLGLSVISFFAVWNMSGVMKKTKDVQDSDLEIRIPPADQVSLDDQFAKLAEDRKKLETTTKELDAAKKGGAAAKEKADALESEKGKLTEEIKKADENALLKEYVDTGKFAAAAIIGKSRLEWKPAAVAPGVHYRNDLVSIYQMAECPYCGYGVPIYCFRTSNKCVLCGKTLKTPPPQDKIKSRRKEFNLNDEDDDGIDDDKEKNCELDPKNPNDALQDSDEDGFSNKYEINIAGTHPKNPADCPPQWRRLRFKDVKPIELPIEVTSIDVTSKRRENWEVSLKFDARDPQTGELEEHDNTYNIGSEFEFDGRNYKVSDIGRRTVKDKNGQETREDFVVLQEVAEGDSEDEKAKAKSSLNKLTLVLGKPAYSPEERVILEDVGFPEERAANGEAGAKANDDQDKDKTKVRRYFVLNGVKRPAIYSLRPGDEFKLYFISDSDNARKVPRSTYVLKSYDAKRRTAVLWRVTKKANPDKGEKAEYDDKDDKERDVPMVVTADGYIPDDCLVASPENNTEAEKSAPDDESRRDRR